MNGGATLVVAPFARRTPEARGRPQGSPLHQIGLAKRRPGRIARPSRFLAAMCGRWLGAVGLRAMSDKPHLQLRPANGSISW